MVEIFEHLFRYNSWSGNGRGRIYHLALNSVRGTAHPTHEPSFMYPPVPESAFLTHNFNLFYLSGANRQILPPNKSIH